MSSQLSSRLGSSITELTAEGGKKSFFVHTNLLTAQSPSLEATITAGRKLDLQSWDSDTVGHFVNFLYLGTYDVPPPKPHCLTEAASDSATTATNSRVHTPDTEQGTQQDTTTEPRPLTPVSLVRMWVDEDIDSDLAAPVEEGVYHLRYPQETHDYHNVLLAHMRVYALAQSLSIDRLRRPAYRRLSVILRGLKPIATGSALARSVVRLLGNVYAEIEPMRDPMRKLVSKFAALNFTALQRMVELEDVMCGGGDLVVDLMSEVAMKLVAAEDALEQARTTIVALQLQERNFRLSGESIIGAGAGGRSSGAHENKLEGSDSRRWESSDDE